MAEMFDDKSYSLLTERVRRWEKETEDWRAVVKRVDAERDRLIRESAEIEQLIFEMHPDRERAEEWRRGDMEREHSYELDKLTPAQREDAKHVLNRFLAKSETQ